MDLSISSCGERVNVLLGCVEWIDNVGRKIDERKKINFVLDLAK